jgi:hypothetical protein
VSNLNRFESKISSLNDLVLTRWSERSAFVRTQLCLKALKRLLDGFKKERFMLKVVKSFARVLKRIKIQPKPINGLISGHRPDYIVSDKQV